MLPILLSTVWIGISEFVRNEFLLKDYWTRHYEGFGLVFPAEPINGALWGGMVTVLRHWKFLALAAVLLLVYLYFGLVVRLFLMWLVTGNMAVLPFGILWFAIPLSILEVVVAAAIIKQVTK